MRPVRLPSPGQPAADDHLLAEAHLHLEPRAGALARLVAGVEALGDDALEAPLRRRRRAGRDRRRAAVSTRQRGPGSRTWSSSRRRSVRGSPVRSWPSRWSRSNTTYATGTSAGRRRRLGGVGDVHALLQQPEARPTVVVGGDQLAVEQRGGGRAARRAGRPAPATTR